MIRRARVRLGASAWRAARFLYRALPLSTSRKASLKDVAFTVGAPLLRNSASYRAWVERRSAPVDPWDAVRAPVPRPPTRNPHADAYREHAAQARMRLPRDPALPDGALPGLAASAVKLIAFYLPQFHPVPVNDAAWGRGFTEWTNVTKAVPQFYGHYQPRLPGELGFYDLRVPEVQRRQVELATRHGIHGFCFHYYRFGGTRVLERPLEQFYADRSLDIRYCLCWANENWTRAWDGLDGEVILEQVHSPEDDLAFIEEIRRFLEDPRYLRVDGRPVLVVYRASLLPDPAATARRWREASRRMGLPGLFLVAAQTFGFRDPRRVGFDAALEFPPHNTAAREVTDQVSVLNPNFAGHVYDYVDFVERTVAAYRGHAYPVFRGVCPGWDNEARRPGAGHVFLGSDPGTYGRWLSSACAAAVQQPRADMRLVFVNAWNEWAEGAYLEPDRRYGHAYLAETRRVLTRFPAGAGGPELAVTAHVYHERLWPHIRARLYNIPAPFDLFVTLPPTATPELRRQLARDFPTVTVLECENRGRDILPFLRLLRRVDLSRYRAVCKVHTKLTAHRLDGARWRREALGALLASPGAVDGLLRTLETQRDVALIAPPGMVLQSTYYWGLRPHALANRRHVRELARRLGRPAADDFYFVAGSMFWFRPGALEGLLDLKLDDGDFEPEAGQRDGTMAHAVERFLGFLVRANGFCIADTDGRRFEAPARSGRPRDPGSVEGRFAHPTFDGEPL
jgi:lipopolysaccharide biosynthesis protein